MSSVVAVLSSDYPLQESYSSLELGSAVDIVRTVPGLLEGSSCRVLVVDANYCMILQAPSQLLGKLDGDTYNLQVT